jgi:hypothetical protein
MLMPCYEEHFRIYFLMIYTIIKKTNYKKDNEKNYKKNI